MSLLTELQQIVDAEVRINEPLAPYTSFGIGGPADILVTPHSLDALRKVIRLTFGQGEAPVIIGNGTNLLILDKGVRGVVLRISNGFSRVITQDNLIIAESGARLGHLCRISSESGLTGLEWASGIPGALGGALVMNAGAHGGEIGQLVQSVSFIHPDGLLEEFRADQLSFGYRTSSFQNMPGIIAGATLCLKHADAMEIHKLLCETIKLRCDRQPVSMQSAGSVFKRPPNDYAGRLVEEAGCKGLCVGGAKVSEKHANFIVNTGNATAADVLELIRQVQEKVYEHFDIKLETEVRVIGA